VGVGAGESRDPIGAEVEAAMGESQAGETRERRTRRPRAPAR
jgi:hypothetical protein